MENKDKVDALIWNNHPIRTRELFTATGIEKPMVMERAACIQGLFYICLKFLIKIPLNKEIYPFSQRP
jgi:hypothetical protein